MAKLKRLSKRIIALIVAGGIIALLGLTALGFFIGFWHVDATTYIWRPDYEMMPEDELKAIYEKDELTEEDYEILFEQTGLTKVGIDRAKSYAGGWTKVKNVYLSYFKERSVMHGYYAPLICTDYIEGDNTVAGYLETGDIIISSSTHFSGFKIGHCAIVTDSNGKIYQSNQVGTANGYGTFNNTFSNRVNFMVLRIKPEYFSSSGQADEEYFDNLARAARYIETQFTDVPYSVFTGVFTKKDGMKATTCSHLVWYGFKHFDDENGGTYNIDLDSNGRLLAMPKDITLSPYVELVQTFGFDPEKLYE